MFRGSHGFPNLPMGPQILLSLTDKICTLRRQEGPSGKPALQKASTLSLCLVNRTPELIPSWGGV